MEKEYAPPLEKKKEKKEEKVSLKKKDPRSSSFQESGLPAGKSEREKLLQKALKNNPSFLKKNQREQPEKPIAPINPGPGNISGLKGSDTEEYPTETGDINPFGKNDEKAAGPEEAAALDTGITSIAPSVKKAPVEKEKKEKTGVKEKEGLPGTKEAKASKEPVEDTVSKPEKNEKTKAKAGGGAGGGARATDMAAPSLDGGGNRLKQENDSVQAEESRRMEQSSKKKAEKGKQGIGKLSKDQQKKDPAETKLQQSEKAVVEKKEEKESEAKAEKVDTVAETAAPEAKKEEAGEVFNKTLQSSLPKTIEDVDNFKKQGKASKVGDEVRKTIESKTGEISGTFGKLKDPGEAAPVKESVPFKEIEKADPTQDLNVGEKLVPAVSDEALNLDSYVTESDNLLKREGIKEEHLEMVDSGDLFEAKQIRDDVAKKVEENPAALKNEEEQLQGETDAHLSQKEKSVRGDMEKQRTGKLGGARADQEGTKTALEKKKEEVSNHINQIYENTNEKVQAKLDDLKNNSFAAFERAEAQASAAFEANVSRRMEKFKKERYEGATGAYNKVRDWFLGIDELPEVAQIFETEKSTYINSIDAAISTIITQSQLVIDECKGLIAAARKEIEKYVKSLPDDLKKIGQNAQKDIQKKLDELDEKVNKAAEDLKKELEKKRAEAIKKLDEKIANMREEMSGFLAQMGDLMLDAALKFFKWALEAAGYSIDQIMPIINKGKAAITAIVSDPVKFFQNLANAVGGGIKGFAANIQKYLGEGFMTWLTGQMSALPIQLPEKWDLKGIVSLVLQVLGLGWTQLRGKLSNKIGEDKVQIAEQSVEVVAEVKEKGPVAMYEMMEDKAADIQAQVMDGAKEWAIINLIKQGVIRLAAMLNPAGAVVQAILAIYNGITFFVDNWDRLVEFVNSIFDSISNIASGAVGAASKLVEKSMAMTIPLILDFLAKQLNLSGIADRIQKIIERVRKPIDQVIDRIIRFITEKVKKIAGKVLGKDKGKNKKESKEDTKKDFDKDKGEEKTTDVDRKEHEKYAEEIARRLSVSSKASKLEDSYNEKLALGKQLEKEYKTRVKGGLKVVITFESFDKVKDDSDISFEILITPNSTHRKGQINLKNNSKLKGPAYLHGGWEMVPVYEGMEIQTAGGRIIEPHGMTKHSKLAAESNLIRRIRNAKKAVEAEILKKIASYRTSIPLQEALVHKTNDPDKKAKHEETLNNMRNNEEFLLEQNFESLSWMEDAKRKLGLTKEMYTFNASAFTSDAFMRKIVEKAIKEHQNDIDRNFIEEDKNNYSFKYSIPPTSKLYAKGVTFDENMKEIIVESFQFISVVLNKIDPDEKKRCRFILHTVYPTN